MPYSKAHYYLIGLLGITVVAFWPSYFGKLNDAPIAHHLHGITSTFWILLLATQNWLIHNRKRVQHKAIGKIMFVLVPLMIAAFAMVTWVGAQKAIGDHPFYQQFGQALLTVDVMLTITTTLQIYLALKFRFNVRLHSALMLGTLIGLLPPILSRLLVDMIPSWNITGLDTLYKFGYGLHASIVISTIIGVILYFCYRRDGWPWILATLISALTYILYATVGQTQFWSEQTALITSFNPMFIFGFGFLLGLLACLLGWLHGKHKS